MIDATWAELRFLGDALTRAYNQYNQRHPATGLRAHPWMERRYEHVLALGRCGGIVWRAQPVMRSWGV